MHDASMEHLYGLLAALSNHVREEDLARVDGDSLAALLASPSMLRERFVAFANSEASDGRVPCEKCGSQVKRVERIDLDEPLLQRELGPGFTFWRGPSSGDGRVGAVEQSGRCASLRVNLLSGLERRTPLYPGERSISGEEVRGRMLRSGSILMDFGILLRFQRRPSLLPASWRGAMLQRSEASYFFGTVLRSPDGERCVPGLLWNGSALRVYCRALSLPFRAQDGVVVLE